MCDTKGLIYEGRQEGMNPIKDTIAYLTNKEKQPGTLSDALKDADIFIGVSVANLLTPHCLDGNRPNRICIS